VTKEVTSALRLVRDLSGNSTSEGYLMLPDNFNEAFGDTAFGALKVLVVEYQDKRGNNMTAVWDEGSKLPRVFFNTPNARMFKLIVNPPPQDILEKVIAPVSLPGSAVGKIGMSRAAAAKEPTKVPEAWSSPGGTSTKSTDWLQDDIKPPPPVIPFIKYASPGPPQSPWLEADCTLPAFRILSLDGGGVRGVISAVILSRLVKAVPTLFENVDLIAGTSTGGLISLMLAAGYTPRECQRIYEYGCPLIFSKDLWRVYNPLKAKYAPEGREDLCRTYLGEERTLKDLKKHVVLTSFKLDGKVDQKGAFIQLNGGWRPAVFSNIPKLKGLIEPDYDLVAWDAALRTSAAPTYFPAHKGYVDGAMFANNPSMVAVSKACAHFPNVSPENIVVLSLGAGVYPMSIQSEPGDPLDWGIKDWVPYILDLMMDGDSLSSELLLRYMLGTPGKTFSPEQRYHRIDPLLPKYTELDDVASIPELIEIARNMDLTDSIKFVECHFSSAPTASDAFAQAAVRTAEWAKEQAKVQLSEVISSWSAPSSLSPPWGGVPFMSQDQPGGSTIKNDKPAQAKDEARDKVGAPKADAVDNPKSSEAE